MVIVKRVRCAVCMKRPRTSLSDGPEKCQCPHPMLRVFELKQLELAKVNQTRAKDIAACTP